MVIIKSRKFSKKKKKKKKDIQMDLCTKTWQQGEQILYNFFYQLRLKLYRLLVLTFNYS